MPRKEPQMKDAKEVPVLRPAEIVSECVGVLLGIMRGLSPAEAPAHAPAAALAIAALLGQRDKPPTLAARMIAQTMEAHEEKARVTPPAVPPE